MPPRTSNYVREANDWYRSPDGVIASLVRHLWIPPGPLWECAAGDGALVRQLEAVGKTVIATDLVDRGPPAVQSRVDFLLEHRLPADCTVILTNPPYKLADAFINHALDIGADQVIMLLPFKWAGATGPSRTRLVSRVSDVVRLGRLRMLPPGAVDQGHNGMVDFAWFVIRQHPQSATRIF